MALRFELALAAALMAAPMAAAGQGAFAAAEPGGETDAPTAVAVDAAELTIQFAQEDGAGSGHVRVMLTPQTRALTRLEAREAAEQAFLHTLREPGLGEPIERVRVVVRLLPLSQADPDGVRQTVIYERRSGREWSVRAATTVADQQESD